MSWFHQSLLYIFFPHLLSSSFSSPSCFLHIFLLLKAGFAFWQNLSSLPVYAGLGLGPLMDVVVQVDARYLIQWVFGSCSHSHHLCVAHCNFNNFFFCIQLPKLQKLMIMKSMGSDIEFFMHLVFSCFQHHPHSILCHNTGICLLHTECFVGGTEILPLLRR